MADNVRIRHVTPDENQIVHSLVQTIADDTFAYLFASDHVPIGEANWSCAWLAVSENQILGVVMTRDEWVTDLWVRQLSRRRGVGAKLLAHGESEIFERGHKTFRLRVVMSNARAVGFYASRGWTVFREFPQEKYAHAMFEMTKSVSSLG